MIEVIATADGHRGRFAVEGLAIPSSRTPFFAAARELLRQGVDPATPLALRHKGADHVALRATVGAAAKLAVVDDKDGRRGIRFALWSPFDRPEVVG